MLEFKGMPFLNALQRDRDILELYASGKVLGFEIDRDETRLLLAAKAESRSEVSHLFREYEFRWSPSLANDRASKFIRKFRDRFDSLLAADLL